MRATIDDIHHRHGKKVRVGAAKVAIEGKSARFRRRFGHRQRDTEDGVGAEPALVGRAIELLEGIVDPPLLLGVHAGQCIEDFAVDGVHRIAHALAQVALLVPVPQLDRLVRPGRGAGGYTGAALRAVLEDHIDLDRGVAAAVQDFTADDVDDGCHGIVLVWRETRLFTHGWPVF